MSLLQNTYDYVAIADEMVRMFREEPDNPESRLFQEQNVYYGDQDMIPRFPALCIDTDGLSRELAGAPFQTKNVIPVQLMVYHGPLQDTQATKRECDRFALDVAAQIEEDLTLGGMVIHGYVVRMESGWATRAGSLVRATRISWEGLSKTGRIGE